MKKIRFNDFDEIRTGYDKGKLDVFYENGNTKYTVSHIGCTLFCLDEKKNLGMGAIQNFDLKYFYGVEKPKPIVVEDVIELNQ